MILSAFAFGGLVYGLSSFGEVSGTMPAIPPWVPLAVGVVGMVVFVLRQIALQNDRQCRCSTCATFRPAISPSAW